MRHPAQVVREMFVGEHEGRGRRVLRCVIVGRLGVNCEGVKGGAAADSLKIVHLCCHESCERAVKKPNASWL